MPDKVMQPFRPPRAAVDRVHRKDNSLRFKEMEKWMDRNLTGEKAKKKDKTDVMMVRARLDQVRRREQRQVRTNHMKTKQTLKNALNLGLCRSVRS
jgi:hypothetical protein